MSKHIFSLLCLGDSYTVGEGVPLHQSFPYQTVQMLRAGGVQVHAPEIVAQTGWTSFELGDYLIHHRLQSQYDFVTLLTGVNNQYRGLAVEDFAEDFEFLLKKAINLTPRHAAGVFVYSIPDWGITPFAAGKNKAAIAAGIDAYNTTAALLCAKYNITWADMTEAYRKTGALPEMLAADGLHPSGKVYAQWAEQCCAWLKAMV